MTTDANAPPYRLSLTLARYLFQGSIYISKSIHFHFSLSTNTPFGSWGTLYIKQFVPSVIFKNCIFKLAQMCGKTLATQSEVNESVMKASLAISCHFLFGSACIAFLSDSERCYAHLDLSLWIYSTFCLNVRLITQCIAVASCHKLYHIFTWLYFHFITKYQLICLFTKFSMNIP